MNLPAEMKCRACGWWPPMVRERRSGDYVRVVSASESWRWRQLREHILDVAYNEPRRPA
jgi:hypothetical protein